MDIVPILVRLRRNWLGAALVMLQVAITVAVACNAFSILDDRFAWMRRDSGLDEANIVTLSNQWVGHPAELAPRIHRDLSVLRELPGVVDAASSNGFPLRGFGAKVPVTTGPEQTQPAALAALYFSDDHTLDAWGLRLAAGRWFLAEEVFDFDLTRPAPPIASVVVTEALSRSLYAKGDGLGRTLSLGPIGTARIVGVVRAAQAPWAAARLDKSQWPTENAVFLPRQLIAASHTYVIRTQPGQLASVMSQVAPTLYRVDPARIVDEVKAFPATRSFMYRADRSLAWNLGALTVLLCIVSACGIVGLTSYWVTQRTSQVGIHRALGARSGHVLGYFHLENLLISGAGTLFGILLGAAANLWLARHMEMTRLDLPFVMQSALIVMLLSQVSVLWPALRAASVDPAVAIRSG